MRETVRDRERLEHIQEAIDRILTFATGKTEDDLKSDKMYFYGIVKNIEIIGEATYKLTKAFRKNHSETPWDRIEKMRHVLVHDYFQIDENEVLYVIEDDLHVLREQVARYLTEVDWEDWEKNEEAIVETATHKSLLQTAVRMKSKGYDVNEIRSITGLNKEEIEDL